jgi:hypothetical protein
MQRGIKLAVAVEPVKGVARPGIGRKKTAQVRSKARIAVISIFEAISQVFATIPYIFTPVDYVFSAIPYVLSPIRDATVSLVVAHIFSSIPNVFTPVAHVFAPVAHILTTVPHIFPPIRRQLPNLRSRLYRGSCRSRVGGLSLASLSMCSHTAQPDQEARSKNPYRFLHTDDSFHLSFPVILTFRTLIESKSPEGGFKGKIERESKKGTETPSPFLA